MASFLDKESLSKARKCSPRSVRTSLNFYAPWMTIFLYKPDDCFTLLRTRPGSFIHVDCSTTCVEPSIQVIPGRPWEWVFGPREDVGARLAGTALLSGTPGLRFSERPFGSQTLGEKRTLPSATLPRKMGHDPPRLWWLMYSKVLTQVDSALMSEVST